MTGQGGRGGRGGQGGRAGQGRGTPAGRDRAGQGRGTTEGGGRRPGGVAGPRPRTGIGQSGRARPAPAPPEPREEAAAVDVHDPAGVRLQKVLAQAGVGSRRTCEQLIEAGRVQVDGRTVRELGVRIDPKRHTVHVDGVRVQLDETLVYLAMNKPAGVVSTMSDPEGRPCLSDFVVDRGERLFHVGRLDFETEGLILLTNDGELANRLAHPSHGVAKTYLAEVAGVVPRDLGRRLREGIELDDGPVAVDEFRVVDARPGKALVEVVLHEGRNRVVRRMLAAVGLPVEKLVRTQVGPIRLGDLRSGRVRAVQGAELGSLMSAAGL